MRWAAAIGEHTFEVLTEAGFEQAELTQLELQGVLMQHRREPAAIAG